MKKKIIILLVLLLGISWFTSISTMLNNPKELKSHILEAEKLDAKGIYIDAIEEYKTVLSYKPDDNEIRMKIAQDYLEINDTSKYVNTLKEAIELQKKGSEEALDTLMQYYIDNDAEYKAAQYIKSYVQTASDVKYVQEWYLRLKGSYETLYCQYDEMYGMYNDYMIVKSGEFYTLVDASGNSIFEPIYKELTPFSIDGYALTVNENGEGIYIDTQGLTRVVPDANYKDLGLIINSRIVASDDGKYGYLDENGEPVTKFKWSNLTAFNEVGLAEKNGKWALIDSKGKEKTKYKYSSVVTDVYGIACNQGCIFVENNEKYQLINKKGKKISKKEFDDAKAFSSNGYAPVCKDGKWGYINSDGKLVIDYTYDDAKSFSNGYAAVCKDGKWGYIDSDNNLIIDTTFLDATNFSTKGTAAVKIYDENNQVEKWQLIKLNMEA